MKRSFRHWTFRYLIDRTELLLYERRHPDLPWLTREAVDFLASWLQPSDHGLEWGSGRSTVWLAQRVSRLVSIEHNEAWYDRVKVMLAARNLANVDYRLHVANPQVDSASMDHPYVVAGSKFLSGGADFVLVDGAFRDYCAAIALSRVKPGGIIIVDNANWFLPYESRAPSSIPKNAKPATPLWQEFLGQVKGWRHYWTGNGITNTVIYFKPLSMAPAPVVTRQLSKY